MQLSEFDVALTAKDEELDSKSSLHAWTPHAHSHSHTLLTLPDLTGEKDMVPLVRLTRPRRGKVLPVDAFTGENPEVCFDDCLEKGS